MDAPEPLLLSEGVCRQLGIMVHHPELKPRGKSSGQELDLESSVSWPGAARGFCETPSGARSVCCG